MRITGFISLCILLSFFGKKVMGQNEKLIDSLKVVLAKPENQKLGKTIAVDTTVVQTLYFLSRNLALNDPQEALKFGKKALNILDSGHSVTNTISKRYYARRYPTICKALSVISDQLGKNDDAIMYLKKSLHYLELENDYVALVKWYNSLSNLYSRTGNNKLSLEFAFKALNLAEKNHYDAGECTSLKSVALIYSYQNKHDLALPYYIKAVEKREAIKDSFFLIGDYNNLANTYDELGKSKEALMYLTKALELCKQLNVESEEATTLNNLAYYYLDKNNAQKALEYAVNSKQLNAKIDDIEGVAATLKTISICYQQLKQYDKAIESSKEGLTSAKEMGNVLMQSDFNLELYNCYNALGNCSDAMKYFKRYIDLKDTLFNKDVAGQLNELQTKYETEKKEQQNQLLQTQNLLSDKTIKQQQLVSYFIMWDPLESTCRHASLSIL